MKQIAVLFARKDSYYKSILDVDVWDIERDARNWRGGCAVVAHPPCRAWGGLRHLAKPRPDEKDLALWAVEQVRRFGGVLEHPKRSALWVEAGLPGEGEFDCFGGWTLPILQSDWGHKAEKATLLYIVGIRAADLPVMPLVLGVASHVVAQSGRRVDGSRIRAGDRGWRPSITKSEREHTPAALADWLVEVARRCKC